MGAGHDGAAKELRRRLEGRGHRVEVIDFLDAVAFHIGPVLRWFYQVQLRLLPVELRAQLQARAAPPRAGGDGRHVADAAQAAEGDQGVPPRHDRVGVPARVARARPHAPQEAAAGPGRHLPHRLRRPLALGAPRHRPSPRGERDLGRRRRRHAAARTRAHAGRWSASGSATPASTATRCAARSASHPTTGRCSWSPARGASATSSPPSRRSGGAGEFHPITVCGRDEKLRAELESAATAPSSAGPTRCPRS